MSQARDSHPLMKGRGQSSTDWFRIENAHKDEANANDALTKVYIYGDIGDSWWGDGTSANDFVKLLSGIKSSKLELHLNSGGGSAFDGIAIYQALLAHDAEVEVHVDALAASAASIIAMAGDKVIMTTASMMMIHDASMGAYGNADYLRDTAGILDKLSQNGAKVYAAKAGESPDFWRGIMKAETWYDAEEAVAAGLADEIFGETTEEELQKAEQLIDSKTFQFKGRAAAPDPLETRRRVAQSLGEKMSESAPEIEATPEATPAAPAAPEVAPENPEDVNPEPTPAAPVPATPEEPPAQHVPVQSSDGKFTFMVGGVPTTDMTAVQNRITMLETFQRETREAARNSFVDKLATDKKILQPQVAGLKNFAQSLTEEGYEAWVGTWDGASALSILQSHGPDGSDAPSGGKTDPAAQELETAREIVKQHKLGGMKKDALEATDSFKKLKAADSAVTFETI